MRALHKRPVPTEYVDEAIDRIEQKHPRAAASARSARRTIGEMVMRELNKLDKVAYIRFASVYEDFQGVDDFRGRCSSEAPGTQGAARGRSGGAERRPRRRPPHVQPAPTAVHGPRAAARGARPLHHDAQSARRLRDRHATARSSARAGTSAPASRMPRSTRCARPARRRGGATVYRHARALQPSRPHAALRRGADRGAGGARRRGDAGSRIRRSPGQGFARLCAAPASRSTPACWRTRRAS